MGNKNYLKFIIPVVAVLVVVESVVLVGNLGSRNRVGEQGAGEPKVTVSEPTKAAVPLIVSVKSESQTVGVGEMAKARVEVLPRVAKAVDGVSVYIKFDPTKVKVSGLEFNANLPKPIVGKVSKSGDMVVVNYLIAAKDGYQLAANLPFNLLTFSYQPLKAGEIDFNLLTSKESKDSATMIVENGSSLSLSFETQNLRVKAEQR